MKILDFLHFQNPTEGQKKVLLSMEDFVSVENLNDFMILIGAAGTGKTSITSALVGYLNSIDVMYKIVAPTGRAARIIGRKTNSTSSTIHSLIYTPVTIGETGRVKFKLKLTANEDPIIFIIDEASMIAKEQQNNDSLFQTENGLLYDLIEFIKHSNPNNKIVFLGDRYQLPPIYESESYALNPEFLETRFNLRGLIFELTEVKRQEDGSYILEHANEIRRAFDDGVKSLPVKGVANQNIFSAASKFASNTKRDGLESQIAIGVSNKANKFFNDLVREKIFGTARKILESGDLLMVTHNWNRSGVHLYNGDHVELISVDWGLQEQVAGIHFVAVQIKVLFQETETQIEDLAILETIVSPGGVLDENLMNALRKQRYVKNNIFRESNLPCDDRYLGALQLTYGHAITCNKAQGGEWKKVFINTLGIPTLKWQYTAVTRAKESIEKF